MIGQDGHGALGGGFFKACVAHMGNKGVMNDQLPVGPFQQMDDFHGRALPKVIHIRLVGHAQNADGLDIAGAMGRQDIRDDLMRSGVVDGPSSPD